MTAKRGIGDRCDSGAFGPNAEILDRGCSDVRSMEPVIHQYQDQGDTEDKTTVFELNGARRRRQSYRKTLKEYET